MPEYRADIDGLRAIAILPVVFFHAGFGFAQGGFVGVDVFFVISGYLITSLIHREMIAGDFSLVRFYERRVRRLFPALFAMLAVCAAMSAWLLLPQDLRYFGGSLFATTLFSSNIFFWLEAGYFDVAAERKPLLHTWSLAVEEQFYLLFPLFLLLVLRYLPRRPVAVTGVVTVVSLLASEWMLRNSDSAAFYLAPFRAWELGLGACLALIAPQARHGVRQAEAFAWLGLALIAASVAAFSWQTPFPGLHALVPAVGAALVIWSGSGASTHASRILSARPLVFTGLISYSLYLWHWPLLVFARHIAIRELTTAERLGVLLASVALAVGSWRFIERPFRGRHGILPRRRLFRLAAVIMACLCAVGLAGVAQSGWPQRLDAHTRQLLAGAEDRNPRREACSFHDAQALRTGRACRIGRLDAQQPSFVVWGDSHADALMTAFDQLAAEHGQAGLYLGKIGCPPLLDVERVDSPFGCQAFNDAARELIAASPARRVILVARWSHFTSEPVVGQEERQRVVIVDAQSKQRDVRGNDAVLARGLERTLELLGPREVFVVSTVPEIGYPVPQTLAQAHRLGRDVDIRPTLDQYRQRQRGVETLLEDARRRHGFRSLDPASSLCGTGRCQVESGGRPLYFDEHHLSVRGATAVAETLRPAFE
jgi:peptidoglycan/LPS O-acetylase OafA/YrhL